MSKFIVICCIVILVGNLTAQPKLKAPSPASLNFGEIYSGTKIARTLVVRNEGTDTLKISDVSVSCGCTVALISSKKVAPGDSAALTVTFKSGAYLDKTTKSVIIDSDDPTNPRMYINFTVDIKTVLRMNPRFIYFGRVKKDSVLTKTVQLENTTKETITILSLTPKDSQLTSISIGKKTLKPGEITELKATFCRKASDYIQGEIEIQTDYKPYPLLSLGFNSQPAANKTP